MAAKNRRGVWLTRKILLPIHVGMSLLLRDSQQQSHPNSKTFVKSQYCQDCAKAPVPTKTPRMERAEKCPPYLSRVLPIRGYTLEGFDYGPPWASQAIRFLTYQAMALNGPLRLMQAMQAMQAMQLVSPKRLSVSAAHMRAGWDDDCLPTLFMQAA